MNTTTAAATAGVTVATIRTWCRYGAITAVKQAGRWIIDTASLTARIAIGAMRTRKAPTMTEPPEQYPWDSDHAEAADFARLVQGGITPDEIVAALGSDAKGPGRYRSLNGRSRRWIDSKLAEVELAAEEAARRARPRTSQNLATDRQIGYILDLLAKRDRDGNGDGFFNGPTTRAGIAKMSRSEASSYIASLKGEY